MLGFAEHGVGGAGAGAGGLALVRRVRCWGGVAAWAIGCVVLEDDGLAACF